MTWEVHWIPILLNSFYCCPLKDGSTAFISWTSRANGPFLPRRVKFCEQLIYFFIFTFSIIFVRTIQSTREELILNQICSILCSCSWISRQTNAHCLLGEDQGGFHQKIWWRQSCNSCSQQPKPRVWVPFLFLNQFKKNKWCCISQNIQQQNYGCNFAGRNLKSTCTIVWSTLRRLASWRRWKLRFQKSKESWWKILRRYCCCHSNNKCYLLFNWDCWFFVIIIF